MDLFIAKGYDKTSLREIAEQLGFTKAAIYYHFASKEDILLALHLRLHEFGTEALVELTSQVPTMELWAKLLDQLVDQMLANRNLFLLHERNQAAFEMLHHEQHEAQHDDMRDRFNAVLSDNRIPVRDRVRMAASFGAVMGAVFISGESFGAVADDEFAGYLRDALRDLLQ